MHRLSLNGKWSATCKSRKITVPASVPGDIYNDLLKAGKIPDPYYRDNEKECLWIGRSDWRFSREFTVPAALIERNRVILKCHGLDTLAKIAINGRTVATSDRLKSLEANVKWTVTDVNGKVLDRGSKRARTPVNGGRKVNTLKLRKLLDRRGPSNVLVWLEARAKGEPTSRDLVLFDMPKRLELIKKPGIHHKTVSNGNGSFTITITSKKVALWTWIELKGVDARLSNSFVHLRPGITEEVRVEPGRTLTLKQLKESIAVRSLVDTYRE